MNELCLRYNMISMKITNFSHFKFKSI